MEEQSSNTGRVASIVGTGCAGLGCLSMLVGIVALALLFLEFFNYSLEGTVLSAGSSSLCCGLMTLVVGVVLIMMGRSKG